MRQLLLSTRCFTIAIFRSPILIGFFSFLSLSVLAQPVIENFHPLGGPVGTLVTISGKNFNTIPELNSVYFGGMRAVVTAATATELKVVVPGGTTNELLSVTTSDLTAYSKISFIVTYEGGDIMLPTSFTVPKDSALEGTGYEPAIADLDGDGKADVVIVGISNFPNTPFLVSILRNTSTGKQINFAPPVNIRSGGTPYRVLIGDIDGDSKQDLVVLQYTAYQFKIYRNISTVGNLSFTEVPGIFQTGPRSMNIAIHDVDRDGKPDIISEHFSPTYTVSVFRNTGIGSSVTFAPRFDVVTNQVGGSFAMGDVDTDGYPDLGIYNADARRIFLMRNASTAGAISFGEKIDVFHDGTFMFKDVNVDSKPDLVVSSGGFLWVGLNTGTQNKISFGPGVSAGLGQRLSSVADINGDGRPDIISYETEAHQISVHHNTSNGGNLEFAEKINFPTGQRPYFVAVGDLNNDGKPDIVSTNLSNTFSVLRNKIAEPAVQPSGSNEVIGEIFVKVRVDSTVNAYNGSPYVQRHYDIEPEYNATTATATVTLYFTQQDFNNFNRYVTPNHKLPAYPSDVFGKGNLRVYQFHGTSTTGEPGSYPDDGIEINPDDDKIVWNFSTNVWEVTFDIVGFSGFFVGSSGTSILPLKLLSFTAEPAGANPKLNWVTAKEVNSSRIEVMRSLNAGEFKTIVSMKAKGGVDFTNTYQYRDTLHSEGVYYYKLKLVDIDGSFQFSKTISLPAKNFGSSFTAYPNPAPGFTVVRHPVSRIGATIELVDMAGRLVRTFKADRNAMQTDLDLRGTGRGIYTIVWKGGGVTLTHRLVVQ